MAYTNWSKNSGIQSHFNSLCPSDGLVTAAQSGSAAAFSELYGLYERRIYRTILSITRNKEDAEDALQDAFLRAYLAINSFEGRSSFSSWMTRIAVNSALGILRKRRVRSEMQIDSTHELQSDATSDSFRDTSPNPEQSYCEKQELAMLAKAIRRLGPDLRIVVERQLIQDAPMKDIADGLGISESAAKSRLYRARRRLSVAYGSRRLVA